MSGEGEIKSSNAYDDWLLVKPITLMQLRKWLVSFVFAKLKIK
jgi:hypothetical protein